MVQDLKSIVSEAASQYHRWPLAAPQTVTNVSRHCYGGMPSLWPYTFWNASGN
jgi:hypothetical protein